MLFYEYDCWQKNLVGKRNGKFLETSVTVEDEFESIRHK